MRSIFSEVINDLLEDGEKLKANAKICHDITFGNYHTLEEGKLQEWIVRVENIIEKISGKDSSYFRTLTENKKPRHMSDELDVLNATLPVMKAFKEDFDKGLCRSTQNIIEASLFLDELEQAQELLSSGYIAASAVIAGVVLETHLRKLCLEKSIDLAKLDKMNADLAKSGAYTKLTQKKITAWADVRNAAAHGNTDQYSETDVREMISGVGSFLERELSI